ncbi:hypothetical protein GJAV_G00159130 [Gymnothorax javanicus]|nr:hypothetical protein GJAV_G00159130 [Gymnothorax javanicus]
MDFFAELDEDQLIDYAIQMSIQESYKQNVLTSVGSLETVSYENAQILKAIEQGDIFALRRLSKFTAAFSEVDSRGWLPLHRAAVRPVSLVLENVVHASYNLTLEEKTPEGDTPLILAIEAGLAENVQLLLSNWASPHMANSKNETPLLLAVKMGSYDMVASLIMHGAVVEQYRLKTWTAVHEAARVGCTDVMMLLLRNGGSVTERDMNGVTPLGIAAEYGHTDVLELLINHEGGHPQCLELLIRSGFDVNAVLDRHISENYGDMRKSPLYFSVSNGDSTCTEILLNAGAEPDLDPLHCLLVAVRAGRYEIVKQLLAKQADVNCYFTVVSDTLFPTALHYCLRDEMMMRLLLNNGYDAERCFCCPHDNWFHKMGTGSDLRQLHEGPTHEKIPFCDFISVSYLKHLSGSVVRILLDYVSHVPICSKLKLILEKQREWPEICEILGDIFTLLELSEFTSAYSEVDSKGWLPLHMAAAQPDEKVLKIVLDASYELTMEEKTMDGETAMTLATRAGLVENVRMLLDVGASPNNTNDQNESPLLLAVALGSYDMAETLMINGALVEQICLKRWTALHEAAKVGRSDIVILLLKNGGQITQTSGHGVTPLGIAAEHGHADVMEIIIQEVLDKGSRVLEQLIEVTSKQAITGSGQSPIHSAAEGGHAQCLQLLIEHGFSVNVILANYISEDYGDMRKSPLFFSVSNGDVTCTEMLLNAGANPDLDPLRCLLVAVRAGRYEIVKQLLARQADVNCYFTVVSDTLFPTALQYCLRDEMMMRLLLNNGYVAEKCFCCHHDDSFSDYCPKQNEKIPFCEFISVSYLKHLSGSVVRILLDYISHVPICSKLKLILEKQREWPEICEILGNPRTLKHLCRLVIRRQMTPKRLSDPVIMEFVPFAPRVKSYLLYSEYDLYGWGMNQNM